MTKFFPARRRYPNRRGIVLFVVTVIIAALTLGGMSLLTMMRVELETTRHRLRELELVNTSRSAAALLTVISEMRSEQRDRLGGIYDNPNLFCNRVVLTAAEGGDDSAFTIVSPRLEEGVSGIRYGLVNESTRLNLGALLEWDKESPGTAKATLMKLPGMTSVMADSLLDWIDSDEETRPDGAEAPWYAARRLTYSPRNALPVSLDEFLLTRGITRYQLYGLDTVNNYSDGSGDQSLNADQDGGSRFIGSLQTPSANVAGMRGGVIGVPETDPVKTEVTIPWARLLTVFSAERDVDPEGRAKIDLNEKDLSFLYDELAAAVGEPIAAFVILARQYGLTDSAGNATAGRSDLDLTLPGTFTFKTPLDIVGASVRVPSSHKVFLSPLAASRESVTQLFQYLDYASIGSSAVLTGRINVNEAPRAVLELVPGLDSEMVTRILNSRPAPGIPVSKLRRHTAWLFADGIADLGQMKALWEKLTTGGDVFRAQIVAFSEKSGTVRRAEIAIDAAVTPARQVFYKDLTMSGRGFSDAVLTNRNAVKTPFPTAQVDSLLNSQSSPDTPFGPMENIPLSDTPFDSVERMTGN